MGLDLRLFAISYEANFVLEKVKSNLYYAIDFDKILDTETLKLHLRMIQKNSDGIPENIMQELIEDSTKVINCYPNKNKDNYSFYSFTRGYETLNYLLKEYLKDKTNVEVSELFYSGIEIENESQFVRFHYIDKEEVQRIYELLEPIEFNELIKYYHYDIMIENIYKLVLSDRFKFLEEEFNNLKKFYFESKMIDAFVIIKIS